MVAPSITQLVVFVTQHVSNKSTNPYRSDVYTISPSHRRSISSIGANQLGMFSHQYKYHKASQSFLQSN